MTTVEKIHKDFFTSGDRLVSAANAIVSKGLIKNSNAPKLIELGFGQCEVVRKFNALKELVESGALAEQYAQKYPAYKFITRKQVDKICRKYKLLFGNVSLYTGSIPQKNIDDILSFKVSEQDLEESYLFDVSLLSFTFWSSPKEKNKEETPKDKKYNKTLQICAPKTMMNLHGHKVVGNEIVPDDPIVLHPVKGGYLIVTAWGKEALDRNVVNEKLN